jgi:DNA mismatch repair ATPase MutS
MHDRRVTRIITPGTLIDETFMDPHTNNYVLAIHMVDPSPSTADTQSAASSLLGLAWLDLSTGHFFTQTTTLVELPAFLARIGPREVVLDESFQANKEHSIFSILQEEHYLISFVSGSEIKPISEWSSRLESPISARSLLEFTSQEIAAGSALLEYVEARLQGSNLKLQPPTRQSDVMGIDKNTMRALEIKKTIKDDNFAGSLLHTIRRTNTKGGARLLDSWLCKSSQTWSYKQD